MSHEVAPIHELIVQAMANWRGLMREEIDNRAPTVGEIAAKDIRGTVIEKVVRQEQGDAGPFQFGARYKDGTLKVAIDSLLAIRDSIPPDYRDAARCEIDSVGGYEDSHYAIIRVEFARPETDEEWAARKADVERRQALAEAATKEAERKEFERLKAKYGEA